ncbi:MAG: hypothetical protein ACYTG0_22260 [Planctomycetota bacterium]|jgi:hypothetical protein
MDLRTKPARQIAADLDRIARQLGPCDVVFADMEAGTPDGRVVEVIDSCRRISEEYDVQRGY